VPGEMREPHLHLTVTFSQSPNYMILKGVVVPVNGHYVDAVAFVRGRMPIETHAVRALTGDDRRVTIPYKRASGEIIPAGTKIIWPFACT